MTLDLHDVLRRLRKVRRTGTGWVACCPAHRDSSPSLSVAERGGKVLMHCHAGCSFDAVCAALGYERAAAADLPPVPRRFPPPPPPPEAPRIDAGALWWAWRTQTRPEAVEALAAALGVSYGALDALGAAWAPEHRAWAFPMRDTAGNAIGIRLRAEDGRKWAVTGSRSGLFIPAIEWQEPVLWICEGPTDTAAALTLGLDTIGRPACRGLEADTARFARQKRVKEVVIVADNDTPGQQGAAALAAVMPVPFRVWVPPAKDIRALVAAGATPEEVTALVKGCRLQPGR